MEIEGLDTFVDQSKFRVGDVIALTIEEEVDLFFLACFGEMKVGLLSLSTGFRWDDAVMVKDIMAITTEDMGRVIDNPMAIIKRVKAKVVLV